MMPEKLPTTTAQELLESPLRGILWIVEGLIAVGLSVFCGSPKVGKSWMMALLALCVSSGTPFLGHATAQCDVLYLSLEDTLARLQGRLFHLVDEADERFHISTEAKRCMWSNKSRHFRHRVFDINRKSMPTFPIESLT